jgi:hypothetical protein
MLPLLTIVAGSGAIASTPFWLPRAITSLREFIFTRVNGREGIPIPGDTVGAGDFRQVYAHPAANGRSKGAALSDLFWYWLSPGAEVHQEHLEPGERYSNVARATRGFLAIANRQAEDLASVCAARIFDEIKVRRLKVVRLRDLMMPVWAEFYYELVFGARCPREARDLITGNANDVVTALKCLSLRHMARRSRLTRFLEDKIDQGALNQRLPEVLSRQEQAFYLQGVFFNTAIVQMSEAMTHLILAIAEHQDVQRDLLADLENDRYFDRVIAETLRRYPLFGIAHRITSDEIPVGGEGKIPKGSVLCFNYLDYQRTGFENPERFDPSRWEGVSGREATYIPFGVTQNRPCPAQAIALVTMRAAGREFLRRFRCFSSAGHTRSIPNRGPCLLEAREMAAGPRSRKILLASMALEDRIEDVWRSLLQLVFGTIMILHARKLRLTERYFDSAARCPVGGQGNL